MCLRLQFRSVGSGSQWISEGVNCVKFLFKFVTRKIGPLSHLNDIFLSCFLCFRVCLFIDVMWSPAWRGLTSWLLFVMSYCEVVTFQLVSWVRCGLDLSIPYLCPLSYFHVFPRSNICKPFTLCITQSLNSQIHFHLFYLIASFCI